MCDFSGHDCLLWIDGKAARLRDSPSGARGPFESVKWRGNQRLSHDRETHDAWRSGLMDADHRRHISRRVIVTSRPDALLIATVRRLSIAGRLSSFFGSSSRCVIETCYIATVGRAGRRFKRGRKREQDRQAGHNSPQPSHSLAQQPDHGKTVSAKILNGSLIQHPGEGWGLRPSRTPGLPVRPSTSSCNASAASWPGWPCAGPW
jgi:hypothetical protein